MGASQAIPVSVGRALSTIPSESNCADIRTEVRCEFGGYISIATTLVTKGYTRIDKRVPLIVRAPENRLRIVTTTSSLRPPRAKQRISDCAAAAFSKECWFSSALAASHAGSPAAVARVGAVGRDG